MSGFLAIAYCTCHVLYGIGCRSDLFLSLFGAYGLLTYYYYLIPSEGGRDGLLGSVARLLSFSYLISSFFCMRYCTSILGFFFGREHLGFQLPGTIDCPNERDGAIYAL